MDVNLISKLYKLSFKGSFLKIKENKSALISTIFLYSIMVGTAVLLLIKLNQNISEVLEGIIGRNDTHLIINAILILLFAFDFIAKLFGKSHKGLNVYSFLTLPTYLSIRHRQDSMLYVFLIHPKRMQYYYRQNI